MKLFEEERPGSATESGRYKLFLLLILLTSMNYPQTPINGFCRYNKIDVDSGYTSLFQLNFNNDAYSDLILFNPGTEDILILQGDKNGSFSKPRKYKSPSPLSNIENIIDRHNQVTGYFFTSRKAMEAGMLLFDQKGKPSAGKTVKLSSYPDFINIKDIDGDDSLEYLISGSAYDGVSLLYETRTGLDVKKVISPGAYSRALLSDISNDGYQDIAAHNIVTNSIDLYYNNSAHNFYKVRSLPFENKITCFRMIDIDLDGYDDIILSQGKNLRIYFGDYTSSFSTDLTVETDFSPEYFLTADYNKDGLIDITYMDRGEGIVSILFASRSRSFHKEILYLKKKNLEKIIPYYSRFINGIIALSSSGNLYSVTNLASISDNVNLTAGVIPSTIKYFDYNNDGIIDYAFIDSYDQKLKIITRNKEGLPALYFSYTLFENYDNFIIQGVTHRQKRFYCYTQGKKLIEILDADLQKGNFKRSSLYSPGNIIDIKLEYDEDKNSELFIAFSSEGRLGLTRVTRSEMKYIFNTTVGIAGNVKDAWFASGKSSYLYYWNSRNSALNLSRISYNRRFDDIKNLGLIAAGGNCSVTGFTGNLQNDGSDYTISFMKCSEENFTISASDSLFLSLPNKTLGGRFINTRHQLFCGETRFNGIKKLLCYDSNKNKIYDIGFLDNGRKMIITELIDAPGVRSFFVTNMSFRNYHLVYTNSTENCITIIQL